MEEAGGELEDGGVEGCAEGEAVVSAAEGEEGAELGWVKWEADVSHLSSSLCFKMGS